MNDLEKIHAVNEADRASTWAGQNGGPTEVLTEAGFVYNDPERVEASDDDKSNGEGEEVLSDLLAAIPPSPPPFVSTPDPARQFVEAQIANAQEWEAYYRHLEGNEMIRNLDANELLQFIDEATRNEVIRRLRENK